MSLTQASGRPPRPRAGARSGWPAAAGLVALSAVPLTAGSLRLVQLAGGPALMPADPRFGGLPVALVVHILAAGTYALLGVLQLLPRFRRRRPAWHRRAGRVAAGAGLLVAVSALWLTLAYPPKPGTGPLLFGLRLGFGSALAACLALGYAAIRRGDVARHRAWMLRAFAIALAAGTQVFTEGIGVAILGPGVLVADLAKGAGWVVNIAVGEAVIRRPLRRRPRRPHRAVAVGVGS